MQNWEIFTIQIKSLLYYAFSTYFAIIAYLNIHFYTIMFTFSFNNIEDIKNETGMLLRKMRKSKGLSQDELAEKLSLSRITIQNVEAGRNFNIDTLLLILQHFNQLESFNKFIKEKSEEYDNLDSLY